MLIPMMIMIIFRALAILRLMLRLIVVVLLLLVLTTMSILLRFMMPLCLILTLDAALCALLANLSLNAILIINTRLCSCLLDVLRDNFSGLPLLVVLLDILECLALLHDGELWSFLILFPLVLAPSAILLLCFLFLLLIHELLLIMHRLRLAVIATINTTVMLRVSCLAIVVLGRRIGVVITLILALLLLSILVLLVVLPAS